MSLLPSKGGVIEHQRPNIPGVRGAELITQADYQSIKGYFASQPWGYRFVLLTMLLRNTGFRIGEALALERRHVGQSGASYYVIVYRQKRKIKEPEGIWLHPNLGEPLVRYVTGLRPGETTLLWPFSRQYSTRRFNEAGTRIAGWRVKSKDWREFYGRTIMEIAESVLGYGPSHLEMAGQMLGHSSTATTRDYYFKLTDDQRRALQEAVPV